MPSARAIIFASADCCGRAGLAAEVYPEAKGLGKQLKYANRKGFQIAIIAGEEEFTAGTWQVKDLNKRRTNHRAGIGTGQNRPGSFEVRNRG